MNPAITSQSTKNLILHKVDELAANRSGAAMAVCKYLTDNNTLVHITRSHMAGTSPARVSIYTRIKDGVQEARYELQTDQTLCKSVTVMIFGRNPDQPVDVPAEQVHEDEAQELLTLLNSLGPHNQSFT